ncbi:YciI family protein [Algibacter aquimarinus]|uniref:YCII-related domain-containing protein n=1 Tax=Algibacter aquimarinus TaxID=1136748 RepID=A0ABP9HEB5_9FLAO
MKKILTLCLIAYALIACKDESKATPNDIEIDSEIIEEVKDSVATIAVEEPIKKTTKQIKEELTAKGFTTFDYVDEKTKDTILMQQYFMAFLKKGPIRGQNEEESAELQELHLAHLKKMYEMGYADISGPFGDDGDIRGITIYNVPTLKMADSLANSDPMVKAGRLEIEIHPWWAGKGFPLR